MTYRGEMDVERRQGAKTHTENKPEGRDFPTDCEWCYCDCWVSLGCQNEYCPYRPAP